MSKRQVQKKPSVSTKKTHPGQDHHSLQSLLKTEVPEDRLFLRSKDRWFKTNPSLISSSVEKVLIDSCSSYGVKSASSADHLFGLLSRRASTWYSDVSDADAIIGRLSWPYASLWQTSALLRKFCPYTVTVPEEPTIRKWLATDDLVAANDFWWKNPEIWDDATRLLIGKMRIYIRDTLGRAPTYNQVAAKACPGKGVTASEPFNERSWYRKWLNVLRNHASYYDFEAIAPYLKGLIWDNRQLRRQLIDDVKPVIGLRFLRIFGKKPDLLWGLICDCWLKPKWQKVEGNKFFTVPKTSTTLRPACKEASLNMMLQRGIGTCIRDRLRSTGTDLDNQHVYHQFLVLNGNGCTIDLSAASDSLSYELVRQLLPNAWFDHIDRTRATHTIMPDKSIRQISKVSSMGNGWTFELETLIFKAAALCSQASKVELPAMGVPLYKNYVTVYGDDIIIAPENFSRACESLVLLGFTINADKTHGPTSPVKESCGAYYANGTALPMVHAKDVHSLPQLLSLRNRLYWVRHCGAYAVHFRAVDRFTRKVLRMLRISERDLHCTSWLVPEDSVLYAESEPASPCKIEVYKVTTGSMKRRGLSKTSDKVASMLAFQAGIEYRLTESLEAVFHVKRR